MVGAMTKCPLVRGVDLGVVSISRCINYLIALGDNRVKEEGGPSGFSIIPIIF